MSRDETRYPNPEMFIHERFLDAEGTLDDNIVDFALALVEEYVQVSICCPTFGCLECAYLCTNDPQGHHTANASLWTAIVTMLATLDFDLAKDVNGRDIYFEPEWINGIAW